MNIAPPHANKTFCVIVALDADASGYEDGMQIELPPEKAALAKMAVGAFNAVMGSTVVSRPTIEVMLREGPDNVEILSDGTARVIANIDTASAGKERVLCGARRQGTAGGNDAADCCWPHCGCPVESAAPREIAP